MAKFKVNQRVYIGTDESNASLIASNEKVRIGDAQFGGAAKTRFSVRNRRRVTTRRRTG